MTNNQVDIFLSHSSTDNGFAHQLASDLRSATFQDRHLSAWVDEAEIKPGQSIPAMINHGLEISRFIGLVVQATYSWTKRGGKIG